MSDKRVKAINDDSVIGTVLIDFRKAFDLVQNVHFIENVGTAYMLFLFADDDANLGNVISCRATIQS